MPENVSAKFGVWQQRGVGINLLHNEPGRVSEADLAYLSEHSLAFIQVANLAPVVSGDSEIQVELVTTPQGWVIHDYGLALSTTMPCQPTNLTAELRATQAATQHAVATTLAEMIASRNWSGAMIVDSSLLMCRFLWIELRRRGVDLKDFSPSFDDEKFCQLLMNQVEQRHENWLIATPSQSTKKWSTVS